MNDLRWKYFDLIELRVGTIFSAEIFEAARTPEKELKVDFGDDTGIRESWPQITDHYRLWW